MSPSYFVKQNEKKSRDKLIQDFLLNRAIKRFPDTKVDNYGNIVYYEGGKKKRFKILDRVVRYEVQVDMSDKYQKRNEWVRIKSYSVSKILNLIKE